MRAASANLAAIVVAETNILVVEDQRAVAGALRMRLRGLGYDVMAIATDATEAIEKAAELKPDLILMDIKLGDGMDGIEAAHRIRAQFNIPVVYVSAYADRELLDRARATHPAGFINKPFTTKDLLTTINLALDHDSTTSTTPAPLEEIPSTADAVLTTDLEGHVSFINRGAEQLTGWSRDSIVGQPLDQALTTLYGIEAQDAEAIIGDVLSSGKEHALVRKHGALRGRVTDILTPLRDAQGNHFGVALRFGPDTSHMSVASLRRFVEAFRFVIDQLPVGIILVDRNLKVVHSNTSAEQILEASPGVLAMRGHVMAIDDENHAELHMLVRRAADRGESRGVASSEMLTLTDAKAEHSVVVVVTASPTGNPASGEPPYVVLLLFDIPGYRELSAPVLRQLFGLTRSEARLVQSLAGGASLDEGARQLGISVNTARTHLKHIFHKTGAKRQSELIHQVETGPAAILLQLEPDD